MGIYDRDYYRSESFMEALTLRGRTTRWLFLINVVVFLVQLLTRGDWPNLGPFTESLALNSAQVLQGEVWRLLTGAFVHDPFNYAPILFNMWFLWLFGGDIEAIYGAREFLAFYLMAVLASSVAFVLGSLLLGPGTAFGASGVITGLLILSACHFPRRIVWLFFILPAPIWALAGFQAALDTTLQFGRDNTLVALLAHLGGAAFGFVYYRRGWRVLNWLASFSSTPVPASRSQPRLRELDEENQRQPVSVAAPMSADVDEHFEAKVDAVLEKVARQGQHSLTEAEKAVLMRASEIYRKRRM